MKNEKILQFKEAVDAEIKEYEEMEDLYKLKQAILVQFKTDALWEVDEKIVIKMDKIKMLSSQRKEAGKYFGNEDITMSEMIEKAKSADFALAKNLQAQKDKLNILSKTISLYQKTNMDLIKHGLVLVEKKLDIIVDNLLPKPNEYNKEGKNVGNEKMQFGSVYEEA